MSASRSHTHRWTATAWAILLTGCVPYRSQPLDESGLDRSLAVPDQAVLAQMATGLQHPRLAPITLNFSKLFTEEDLAIIGVLVSPELKALRATKGVAQAQVFAAGLLPDPQFSAGLDIPTGGAADLVTAYTFGLSWDIVSLITRPAEQRIAKAQEQRVYYEVAWQEWLVAHQVRLLARRVAYLKSQKDLAHQAAEIAERLLEITRRNVASGDAKVDELGLHQVAFLDARDRELAFARELEQTREQLNRTLGIPPGERVPLAYPKLSTLADLDPNVLFAEARRKRLDLIALQAGYAAQEATVYRAVLGQFPHFTLSVNAARDTSNIRSRGPAVAFDIPILNRNRGAIAVAEATRAQLYQEYAARLHQTRADIATLVADLKRIAEEQAPLANELPELARAERTLRAAVDTGDATLLSYESVRASLLDKQLKLLALEQAAAEQQVALQLAVGSWNAP